MMPYAVICALQTEYAAKQMAAVKSAEVIFFIGKMILMVGDETNLS